MRRLTVLCGGLGGSRFVDSLARAAGQEWVTAVGNVGDDVEVLGLHVSPDLDTVLYTLAGLLDEERGWGVRDESYAALETAGKLGAETWFTLGDRDIGLHLVRTEMLKAGQPLSETFAVLAAALGVGVRLLPATDDPLRTRLVTPDGTFDFQEWFVRRGHRDEVLGVEFEGDPAPAPEVLESIRAAQTVFIAPSNPFVSIQPILAVREIADAVRAHPNVVAVSPLVGGRALRGPLVEMLGSLGHRPDVLGLAELYGGFVSAFVLDPEDAALAPEVEALGMRVIVTPIVMADPAAREDVGRALLEAL